MLQELSGAVNVLVADLDRSGTLDIAALVSQEWEEIWMFDNAGGGRFTPRLLWGSSNADFGSSWLAAVDLDRDSDVDLPLQQRRRLRLRARKQPTVARRAVAGESRREHVLAPPDR